VATKARLKRLANLERGELATIERFASARRCGGDADKREGAERQQRLRRSEGA
jgi:hypothetical protein